MQRSVDKLKAKCIHRNGHAVSPNILQITPLIPPQAIPLLIQQEEVVESDDDDEDDDDDDDDDGEIASPSSSPDQMVDKVNDDNDSNGGELVDSSVCADNEFALVHTRNTESSPSSSPSSSLPSVPVVDTTTVGNHELKFRMVCSDISSTFNDGKCTVTIMPKVPSYSCDWTGFLCDLQHHIIHECGGSFVKCQLCKEPVHRYQLDDHNMNHCELRCITCKWCPLSMSFNKSVEHIKECLQLPMECSLGCGAPGLVRSTLEGHVENDCPLFKIPCGQPGCTAQVERRSLQEHHDDRQLHQTLTQQYLLLQIDRQATIISDIQTTISLQATCINDMRGMIASQSTLITNQNSMIVDMKETISSLVATNNSMKATIEEHQSTIVSLIAANTPLKHKSLESSTPLIGKAAVGTCNGGNNSNNGFKSEVHSYAGSDLKRQSPPNGAAISPTMFQSTPPVQVTKPYATMSSVPSSSITIGVVPSVAISKPSPSIQLSSMVTAGHAMDPYEMELKTICAQLHHGEKLAGSVPWSSLLIGANQYKWALSMSSTFLNQQRWNTFEALTNTDPFNSGAGK
jgi:hypothetical protein